MAQIGSFLGGGNDIGSVIGGRYEIITELAHGSLSVIYLAMDRRLNKQWAVKKVQRNGAPMRDGIAFNGMMAEANFLKRLDSPAFPKIIDMFDDYQSLYIVMDYIEGDSLDKVLDECGAQSEDTVIHWAMQICDALNDLHSQKPYPIIYRDMKPANLILKRGGKYGIIKIVDFSIAREFKGSNLADDNVLGTRGYASPEHYTGHTDVRSDIYSLGVTMHQLLTGDDPRKAPHPRDMTTRLGEKRVLKPEPCISTEFEPVRHWNPELSEGIEAIVNKCVQINPEDRYQNCDELLSDLQDSVACRKASRKKQPTKRWLVLGR